MIILDRHSLKFRILVFGSVCAVGFFLFLLNTYITIQHNRTLFLDTKEIYFPVLEHTKSNINRLNKITQLLDQAVSAGEPELLEEVKRYAFAFNKSLNYIKNADVSNRDIMEKLRVNFSNYIASALQTSRLLINDEVELDRPNQVMSDMTSQFLLVEDDLKLFHRNSRDKLNRSFLAASSAAEKLVVIGSTVAIIFVVLVVAAYYALRQNVFNPINDLLIGVNNLTRGNLDHRLNIESNIEFSTLAVAFNNMISSLKQSYEELSLSNTELRTATRAKNNFLSNMSHELRTPLNAIIGYTDLLQENIDVTPKNEILMDLTKIQRSADHLLTLINDVLDISRIEAQSLQLDLAPCSLLKIITDIETLISVQANRRNLDFKIQYHFPLPIKIVTDGTRLLQILLNLTDNAVKFTHHGGVYLDLSCDKQHSELIFKVRDTGIGISEEKISAIFDVFTQADSSFSRRFGGLGLGLPLVKQLATLLNGTVNVKSSPAHGSLFTFTLSLRNMGPLDYANNEAEFIASK